jgi:hypothetical protein
VTGVIVDFWDKVVQFAVLVFQDFVKEFLGEGVVSLVDGLDVGFN